MARLGLVMRLPKDAESFSMKIGCLLSPDRQHHALKMLSKQQVEQFRNDGYLVIPNFFTQETAQALLAEAQKLLLEVDEQQKTKFTTSDKDHVGDDYFLSSGDKIRAFFEEDAFDAQGQLTRPKEKAVNKLGHALHELNPVYRKFSLENARLRELARDLEYHKNPLVLQSMIICKQPSIGGRVPTHDDSTFLYTDPPSALGFWFALEKCTSSNGCLSFARGSHKTNRIAKRFARTGGGTGFIDVPGVTPSGIDWDTEGEWQMEPCDPGTLVLIDGAVIHRSEKNLSDKSRFIYTFHMIEAEAKYDDKNWLQPTPEMPFSKLFR